MCSFQEIVDCHPKLLCHFFPTSNESSYLTSLPAFDFVDYQDFGNSKSVVYLIVLISTSLMTYDVEHLFICLFAFFLIVFLIRG